MAMSPMLKWQRSAERSVRARDKAKQRRQDIQDLKDAGVYISPDELYRDEYGYIKADAPQWFKTLAKAHKSNVEIREANAKFKTNGHAPVKRKRKKKTMDMKPRKVKIRRSIQMKVLLQGHGISVDLISGTITGYEDFTFLPNGRICTPGKDVISTIQFIHDYV